MKIHNDFTLYFRVVPSGKRVVYYYAYDENGKRLYGKSTGETTLTAARVKLNRLLKEGDLVQKKPRMPTFAEYALGWWEWDTCAYLKKRRKRYNITQGYADQAKRNLHKVLLPYFGKMRMDRITRNDIDMFLDYLIKQGYKNTTINGYYGTMKTMMIEAADQGLITIDPTAKIGRLVNDRKELQIITPIEFKKLFMGDWERVWEHSRIAYTANKLAALSGMRVSEVLGLKGCYLYDGYIYLCMQYDTYGYRPTKTKDKHNIPLPASMIADLNELKRINGDGFLFSTDGGGKPVGRRTIYLHLQSALRNIGITDTERKERKLHVHGWRHFFNTEMLKGGLTIPQAQAITGHKSVRMTELYNHFDPTEFVKVREVQDALLLPETAQPSDNAGRAGPVLAFPVRESEPQRKQA